MEYGLIGEHLPHSFSKIIHEKLAPYSYELHELRPDEVDSFMRGKNSKGSMLRSPTNRPLFLIWMKSVIRPAASVL